MVPSLLQLQRLCRVKTASGNMLFFFCDVAYHVSYPKSLQPSALSRRCYRSVRPLVSGILTESA